MKELKEKKYNTLIRISYFVQNQNIWVKFTQQTKKKDYKTTWIHREEKKKLRKAKKRGKKEAKNWGIYPHRIGLHKSGGGFVWGETRQPPGRFGAPVELLKTPTTIR